MYVPEHILMEKYDVAVIGAGLLGTLTARSLMRYRCNVCVIEKQADVCGGTSKANSAVVYSGYDVFPGTLKAALCVPAAEEFPELCRELGVRYSRCGSLIVCSGQEGEASIRDKYEQGLKNGVKGLRLLNSEEVLALEPNIDPSVRMGMYSENSGTADPWELGIAAFENARDNGAGFLFRTELKDIRKKDGGFELITDKNTVSARCVINCAGLFADKVREQLFPPKVRIMTSATDYAVFGKSVSGLIRHVIFTERENRKKGITAVPTADGNLLLESPYKNKTNGLESRCSAEGIQELLEQGRELLPGIDGNDIIRWFSAVRPEPYFAEEKDGSFVRSRESIKSFSILKDDGMLSFIGIKTPGFTCAKRLGDLAAEYAAEILGDLKINDAFDPVRPAPVRVSDLSPEEHKALINEDSGYGKIVCRCENVTEAEIRNAIRAGASTLDGIKRRCHTSMGQCQGDFCTAGTAAILSEETGRSLEQILEACHD
ncbi:MAG: NAD(P)/FAD-dependent oxidoreductase [Lachnospiraceae bacterium]|nr:NAD(P)/FAD-dependent oxidoreductase [Lachnospiraceae bacterium]